MTESSPVWPEQADVEILSSEPETDIDSTPGVPACGKRRKTMMHYLKGQAPTMKRPPVPPRPRKAVKALHANSTASSSQAAGCRHPLTTAWANAAGRGRQCLRCGAELGIKDEVPDGGRPRGQSRSRRSSQKDRPDELEECLRRIIQAEEAKRKAMVRTAKTKLMMHVLAHLDIAKNLLHGEKEKSPAAAGRPSHSS